MSDHKPSTLIFKRSLRKVVYIARLSRKSARDRAVLSLTRANSMLPISSLPPELMMMIFSLCVPDEVDSLSYDMGWISVSHVCRQWRTIALSCVELWSSIIFSRPKWTKLMLKRSRATPLTFRVDIDEFILYERMLPVLYSCFPRLRALHVSGSHSQLRLLASEIQQMCNMPTRIVPRLETLNFSCTSLTGEVGCWIPCDIFGNSSLQKNLSPSRPPFLRYITFNLCAMAWDSPCYENLTHLSLVNIPELQRPSLLALGSILYTTPELETLSLSWAVDVDEMQSISWKASLPRLRKLSVTDTIKGCAYILAALSFPATTIVDVSCFQRADQVGRWTEEYLLRRFLVPNLFARQAKGATELTLTLNPQVGLIVSLSDTRPDFALTFRLNAQLCDIYWRGVLILIFRTLSLHGYTITDLHLDSFKLLTISQQAELWINFCVLNDLRSLHIHRTIPPLLFEYMLERSMYRIGVGHPVAYPVTPYGALPTMGHFLPKLSSIHFIDVHPLNSPNVLKTLTDPIAKAFTESGLNTTPQRVLDELVARGELPTPIQCLRAFLWARKISHLPIQNLILEKCRPSIDDLNHFRFFCAVEFEGEPDTTAEETIEDGWRSLEEYSIGVYARLLPTLMMGLERTREPPAGQCKNPKG